MPMIAAFIMPHDALCLTPYMYPELKELTLIHKSCCKVAENIYLNNLDIILLTTPQGVALNRSFGIYLISKAEGSAEWQGGWKDFKVR